MRRLPRLVLTNFWFKMLGTMAYTFVFFVGYVYLLKFPAYDTITMPAIWLDRLIGFHPLALPIYLSLWFFVSLPPIFMVSRRDIVTYGVRITVLCLIAFSIFYVWPNAVPPANIDWAQYPGVAFLKGVDAAGNACPSLHVGTAVFSALWMHWRFKDLGFSRGVRWLNVVWCIAIAYSTLATKQHVVLDVVAGAALGWAVAMGTGLKRHVAQLKPLAGPDTAAPVAQPLREVA